MAQRPEDFNLPISAIRKILQDSIPNGVRVTDAAKLALARAASIFILYVTTSANGFSQDNARKRVLGKDVVDALMDLGLGFLVPSLQTALADYHRSLLSKKQAKDKKAKASGDEQLEIEELDIGEEVIIIGSGSESEAEAENVDDESSSEGT